MAEFGVTNTGFVRARLADIRPEIVTALRNNLQAAGLSGDIETRPDSVLGLIIDTLAERYASAWEQLEGVYAAMYPGMASGVALDQAVSFTGVTRRAATRSQGYVVLYGEGGTSIPAGTRIQNSATGETWMLAGDARISRSNVADVTLSVAAGSTGTFTVYIDGIAYSYTAGSGASVAQILAGLAAAITDTRVTAAVSGSALRLQAAAGSSFPLGLSANLTVTALGSPALSRSAVPSTLGADAGSLTTILDAVAGWTSVTNPTAAAAGAIAESDSALRNRYASGMYALGGATLQAITARLYMEVDGVTNVVAFENTGNYTDLLGRPPHSIHVIVEGGLDDQVAASIYGSKSAGIDTHGQFGVPVTDSMGLQTVVRFDRPVPVYIWIKADVTLLDAQEQAFPDAGLPEMRAALAARGGELAIGADVVWQSFFRAVYSVPGVAQAVLRFAASTSPDQRPPDNAFVSANITIQPHQRAMFDTARIEVTSGS